MQFFCDKNRSLVLKIANIMQNIINTQINTLKLVEVLFKMETYSYYYIPLVPQTSVDLSHDSSSQDTDIPLPIQDFNYRNKAVGNLAQKNTDFDFIGPDRQPVVISNLPQYIKFASY